MASDIILDRNTLALLAEGSITVQTGSVRFRAADPKGAYVGISPVAGHLSLRGPRGTDHMTGLTVEDEDGRPSVRITNRGVDADEIANTRVFMDGANGNLTLGGAGTDGDLVLRDGRGEVAAHISGAVDRDANVSQTVHPSAKLKINAYLGLYDFGGVVGGKVVVRDRAAKERVRLDGNTGRVRADDVQLTGDEAVSSLKAALRESEQGRASLQRQLSALANRVAALERRG